MAKDDLETADPFETEAERIAKLGVRTPIYMPGTSSEEEPVRGLAFSSGTPLTVDVIGDFHGGDAVARKYHPSVLRRARRRRFNRLLRENPKVAIAAGLGLVSAVLYGLLFNYEHEILVASVGGSWSFLVPASIALVFSFVHGSFTGAFWDAVGLKPNTVRK